MFKSFWQRAEHYTKILATNWQASLAILTSLSLTLLMGPALCAGQTQWPDHAIKFIVPYTPGGGTDVVSRNLTDKMARLSNWTFVIENKPGVGGNIGLDLIARAHADGYTLGMGQTSNLAINPAIMTNMPFDPVRDIVPVAMVAEVPMLLVVQAQSSFNTVADLIAAAKQKNGGLKQGVSGLGTVGHLAGEMLALQAGYKVLIVPYKGASPALTDLMGGQTDFMLATPQGLMPLIKSGKLRVLAVTSAKRLAFLPDIPTLAESGFKEFQATDWKLVVAPANTPTPILEKLNQVINEALQNKDFIRQLDNEGSTPMGGSLAQAKQFVAQQQEQWATLIKQTSLKF